MPYTINAFDEFMLSVYSRYDGQEAQVDIRVMAAIVAGAVVTDQNACDQFSSVWCGLLIPGMAPSVQAEGATLRRTRGGGVRPITKYSIFGAGAGASVDPTLPKQTCGLISFHTDFGGKTLRGRMYIPFPSSGEANPATGEPSAAYVGATLGAISAEVIAGRTVTVGLGTVVFEYGLHPAFGGVWTKYTSSINHKGWATQKRRGDFGKSNKSPFG